MPSPDQVVINIRTRGGRQAAREVTTVGRSLTALDRSARLAGTGLGQVSGASARLAGTGFRFIGQQANYAGIAVGGLGAIAVKSGIQFDASMEQNRIAFTNFLGSAQAADQQLKFLQKTAAATPFELPQITQASRQLLAYGFNVQQANGYLESIGDAAAGAGLGADAIDRIVTALGQIRGKGKLQAEELNQLGELGIINRGALAKNLHITTAQLADAGNQGISANRALAALKKTLDDKFSGQAAKQAQSFNGQLSSLRDNLNQTLGIITEPAFEGLKRAFGPTSDVVKDIGVTFQRTDLSYGDKIKISEREVREKLRPLTDGARDAIADAHIPEHVGEAFGAATPRIIDSLVDAAPDAAKAFGTAFSHSGWETQAITAAAITHRLTRIASKVKGAKGGGVGNLLGNLALARGSSAANPLWVREVGFGGGGGGGEKGKGPVKKITDAAKKVGPFAGGLISRGGLLRAAGGAGFAVAGAEGFTRLLDHVVDPKNTHREIPAVSGLAGFLHPIVSAIDGDRGRTTGGYRQRATVGRGGAVQPVIQTTVVVDGKAIAKAVHRADGDNRARNR